MEEDCVLYQEFYDQDLASGKKERLHRCAFLLSNDLLVQLANKQHQTGAAVESFRNEMVRRQDNLIPNYVDDVFLPRVPKQGITG